jgi:hypothetical protein
MRAVVSWRRVDPQSHLPGRGLHDGDPVLVGHRDEQAVAVQGERPVLPRGFEEDHGEQLAAAVAEERIDHGEGG